MPARSCIRRPSSPFSDTTTSTSYSASDSPCSAWSSWSSVASSPVAVSSSVRQACISLSVSQFTVSTVSAPRFAMPPLYAHLRGTCVRKHLCYSCGSKRCGGNEPAIEPSSLSGENDMTSTQTSTAVRPETGHLRHRSRPLRRDLHRSPPDGQQGARPLRRHRRHARRSPTTRTSPRSRRPSTSSRSRAATSSATSTCARPTSSTSSTSRRSRSGRPRSRTAVTATSRSSVTSPCAASPSR